MAESRIGVAVDGGAVDADVRSLMGDLHRAVAGLLPDAGAAKQERFAGQWDGWASRSLGGDLDGGVFRGLGGLGRAPGAEGISLSSRMAAKT